jgi:hypothetical protein
MHDLGVLISTAWSWPGHDVSTTSYAAILQRVGKYSSPGQPCHAQMPSCVLLTAFLKPFHSCVCCSICRASTGVTLRNTATTGNLLQQPGHTYQSWQLKQRTPQQQQQQDVYETPMQPRLGLQDPKPTSSGFLQGSKAASDAVQAPDQAAAAAAAGNSSRPNSRGSVSAAMSGSSADEPGLDAGGSGYGPSRRKPAAPLPSRSQPYGPKTSFGRFTAAKQGAAAPGSAAARGGASNPLLGMSGRAPRPGGIFTASMLPPMANGGLARMRQHQQQAAGPEVYMRAAFSSKQARGNDRPGTPWASVPGEWLLLLPCDEAVMRRLPVSCRPCTCHFSTEHCIYGIVILPFARPSWQVNNVRRRACWSDQKTSHW